MENDERPASQRIADDLRALIASGELAVGDRLPSIPELVRRYGVATNTAHGVIRALQSEGLVISRAGSGTFVRGRPQLQPLIRAWYRATPYGSPFKADMERQGHDAAWSYESRTTIAPPEIRERLGLSEPGDLEDVVRTDYLFRADDEPVMLSTSWEPLALTKGTPVVLPEDGMLAGRGVAERMLSIGYPIDDWVEEVGSRLGTSEECQRLDHAAGSIMITAQRTYYSGELAVETADIVVPSDRFRFIYSGKMGRPAEGGA
ncbi:GntR family transcriptional regulator [Nonomuraea sp. bgisy101]|uniref:GntR family transcriptional regulator n=1 Tax=Nonomuraea sp. bgisy101 TaxID=3413784 RepID=UPI003D7080D0